MSTNQNNPLTSHMLQAQQIVLEAKRPGANAAAAIDKLAGLLLTPRANNELMLAGAFPGLPIDRVERAATA